MTDLGKAYLAGIVDGEGTVNLTRVHTKGKTRQYRYHQRILVVNTHIGLLHALREIAGVGGVYESKNAPRYGWNPVGRWYVTGEQARYLIAELLPFLVIKREVAEAVLGFEPIAKTTSWEERKPLYLAQDEIVECVTALNARGAQADFAKLASRPGLHTGYYRDAILEVQT